MLYLYDSRSCSHVIMLVVGLKHVRRKCLLLLYHMVLHGMLAEHGAMVAIQFQALNRLRGITHDKDSTSNSIASLGSRIWPGSR